MWWFGRKLKNRRLRRESVLDVKLRSSQVRAARVRMAAIALGGVFAIVFSVFLVWRAGEMGLNRLVYENKAFAIRSIEIETDGDLSVDHLRRWAAVKKGENLLALDLARVKRDLELVSFIQSASVERILPGTLRIRITERVPLAEIKVPRRNAAGNIEFATFLVDEGGFVMLPMDPRHRSGAPRETPEVFVRITGVDVNQIQAGRRIDNPQLQAALKLLTAYEQSSIAGAVELQQLDISLPNVLLVTTSDGAEVTFGLSDFEQQLRRWQEVYEHGQKLGRTLASLDLAITNNIPARWLEASIVTPVPQKTVKPIRNRKKNV